MNEREGWDSRAGGVRGALLLLAGLFLVGMSGISQAQPDPASAEAGPRMVLEAGRVRVTLERVAPQGDLSPGDRVTLSVVIANNAPHRWVRASLSLSTGNARFVAIKGRGMRVRGGGRARRLAFGRIYRDKPRRFTVTLALGARAGEHVLKLKVHRLAPRPRAVSAARKFVWHSTAVPIPVADGRSRQVSAGGIHLRLSARDADQTRNVDDVSEVILAVENRRAGRRARVRLRLAGEAVQILSIKRMGKGARLGLADDGDPDGGARLVTLSGLRRGRVVQLAVKVKMRPVRVRQLDIAAALRVVLLTPDAGTAAPAGRHVIGLGWRVRNCAGHFHAELAALRAGALAQVRAALRHASRPMPGRPGRWIFRPHHTELAARSRAGRKPSPSFAAGETGPAVQPVFRLAAHFVRYRGADVSLTRRGKLGWVTRRVSADLRNFTGQPLHPAICSGALFMMDYFSGKLGRFRRRLATVKARAAEALTIARQRSRALRKAVAAATGRAPVEVKAGQDVRQGGVEELRAMLTELAAMTGGAELADKVRAAPDGLAALRLMRGTVEQRGRTADMRRPPEGTAEATGAISDDAPSTANVASSVPRLLSSPELAALRRALPAIEAALYLAHVRRNHVPLEAGITGSIAAIRKAHARSCVCD